MSQSDNSKLRGSVTSKLEAPTVKLDESTLLRASDTVPLGMSVEEREQLIAADRISLHGERMIADDSQNSKLVKWLVISMDCVAITVVCMFVLLLMFGWSMFCAWLIGPNDPKYIKPVAVHNQVSQISPAQMLLLPDPYKAVYTVSITGPCEIGLNSSSYVTAGVQGLPVADDVRRFSCAQQSIVKFQGVMVCKFDGHIQLRLHSTMCTSPGGLLEVDGSGFVSISEQGVFVRPLDSKVPLRRVSGERWPSFCIKNTELVVLNSAVAITLDCNEVIAAEGAWDFAYNCTTVIGLDNSEITADGCVNVLTYGDAYIQHAANCKRVELAGDSHGVIMSCDFVLLLQNAHAMSLDCLLVKARNHSVLKYLGPQTLVERFEQAVVEPLSTNNDTGAVYGKPEDEYLRLAEFEKAFRRVYQALESDRQAFRQGGLPQATAPETPAP